MVLIYSPLTLSEACEHYKTAVQFGGLPPEFFPVFWDHASGLICVAQSNRAGFLAGEVVIVSELGHKRAFRSLADFLQYATISLEECAIPGGGVDLDRAIRNANFHARMVDPEASVYDQDE